MRGRLVSFACVKCTTVHTAPQATYLVRDVNNPECADLGLCCTGEHHWVEGVDEDGSLAEPAYDVCVDCGTRRD